MKNNYLTAIYYMLQLDECRYLKIITQVISSGLNFRGGLQSIPYSFSHARQVTFPAESISAISPAMSQAGRILTTVPVAV